MSINVDEINVIKQIGEKVKFSKVDIPKDRILIEELKAIVENSNKTLLDLQNRMALEFPINNRDSYEYISPYSYFMSTYVSAVSYPEEMSYEAYQDTENNIRAKLIENNCPEESFESKFLSKVKELKESYLNNALRYIDAYSYYLCRSNLRTDSSVKMYSIEDIGWSYSDFKINNDITVKILTNFGFGRSSYFALIIQYKGINILPYSYWVKYCFANKESLLRFTRQYKADRDSWDISFKFVEKVTNDIIDDKDTFVYDFIINEISLLSTKKVDD